MARMCDTLSVLRMLCGVPVAHGSFRSAEVTRPRVQMRACMLIAMLTGGAPEAQVELAQTDGAVPAIVAVMRGGGGAAAAVDPEARAVAQQLFKLLVANADARPEVEAALRDAPAPAAAGS